MKIAKENDNTKFPLRRTEPPPEPEIQKDGTIEYEVDRIVDHRTRYNRREYRVRWKGYDNPDDDTWETIKTLHKVRNLVKEYEDKFNSIEVNSEHNHKPNRRLTISDRIENSLQCEAKTRRNIRCKNRTRRSNMCQPHLRKF